MFCLRVLFSCYSLSCGHFQDSSNLYTELNSSVLDGNPVDILEFRRERNRLPTNSPRNHEWTEVDWLPLSVVCVWMSFAILTSISRVLSMSSFTLQEQYIVYQPLEHFSYFLVEI